jgi:hypothetical protein
MTRTLVCCAYSFGYGPAAKLLHIARHLCETDWRLIFLGHGIARELAERSDLFADIICAATEDEITHSLLTSADGVLSLMERDFTAAALQRGKPVFVVDSLSWMRERIPSAFREATRYYAQDFIGVRERLVEVGDNARLVGPIVGPTLTWTPGERIVVNVGGCAAPRQATVDNPEYVEFIARTLGRNGALNAIVIGGDGGIRQLRAAFPHGRSASHEEALTLFREARCVLTAPGLTATLECFQLGVPTFFLPPQNYSQWWILLKLRERGLAPASFHWLDVLPNCNITERMAADVRAPIVRAAIREAASNETAERELGAGIESFLAADQSALGGRQHQFFAALGSNGAAQVARELIELL